MTFKTDSIRASIPIVEGTRSQLASYLPNAADTAYAALPEIKGAKLVEPAIHSIEEYHLPVLPEPERYGKPEIPASPSLLPLVKSAEKEIAKPEALSVAYGQRFVSETVKEATPAQEKAGQLPQTGSAEEWMGFYGLGTLFLSSLLFWKKKKEENQG